MIEQLDDKQQRTLAIALLALVVVIVVGAIAVPVWTVNASYRDDIEQLQSRLQRLRAVAASDGELRPRYEQYKATQRAAGHFLRSSTDAVAAAELQGVLKNLASANGAQVLSTQILPAIAEDQFVRVALRARLRGTLTDIVNTLHTIETNDVFLFLDNVSVRDSTDRRRALPGNSVQFEVDLDLITYVPGES